MVATGLTVLSFAVVLTFALFVGWVVLRFLELASSAIIPVVLGLFLAMLFKPYYAWFVAKVRNPSLALVLMMASVLVPLGLLLWFGGAFVITQVTHLVASAPTVVTRFSAWVNVQFPQLQSFLASVGLPPEQQLFFSDPAQFSHDLVAQLSSAYGEQAVRAGMGVLKYLAGIGTALVTLLFFAFFVMRPVVQGRECVAQMPFLKEETKRFVAQQIDLFIDIVVSFFQRQVMICLIEGVLYGLGFTFVGLPYGFVLGFLLGALNLVPLLGTVVVLPMALPIAYFGDDGSLLRLLGVVAVWLTGQVLDGYLITPKIQGEKTGLGYAGVIFSFFFWGVVFHSMLGLLLAIPLSAFCVVLWRALREKYIRGVI
ncbi:MAG: AI-2E family transporter [Kiritimatiellae bacterium]|nr:AI-2E family transporter [Kiritimatiellia bacterium]